MGILFRSDTSSQARKEWVQSAVRYANQPVQNAYPGAAPKVPLTRELTSNADVRASFPASLRPHLGDVWTKFDSHEQLGYLNPQAGWTEARAATFAVLDEARRLGAEVVSNVRITQLLSTDGQRRVRGAVASDGRVFEADSVIVAAGCWTASLLETLGAPLPRPVLAPSAHCVVTFELTPDVARLFRGMPVLFNMSSGLYAFEPNQDRILKCALHRVRCILTQTGATTPNPRDFQGEEFPIGDGHPHVEELTKEVLAMFPVLKLEGPSPTARRRPTRMCWYSDTLDENFLIDFHPDFDNVLVASGDSGHGLKVCVGPHAVPADAGPLDCVAPAAHQQRRGHRPGLWLVRAPAPRILVYPPRAAARAGRADEDGRLHPCGAVGAPRRSAGAKRQALKTATTHVDKCCSSSQVAATDT